jgi:hypothetical protein
MNKKDFYRKDFLIFKRKYKLLDKKYEQKFNDFEKDKKDS